VAHIRKLPNGRFEARYRAPDGRERSRRFPTKREAQAYLDQVGVDRRVGTWHDPRAGRIPLAEWVTQWGATTVTSGPPPRPGTTPTSATMCCPASGQCTSTRSAPSTCGSGSQT
jgi:hypothetical protein